MHAPVTVFGYTGMQGFDGGSYHPEWHDLTAGAAWIIQHLYDYFVYNPTEVDFFRAVTWPLMKVRDSVSFYSAFDSKIFASNRDTLSFRWGSS